MNSATVIKHFENIQSIFNLVSVLQLTKPSNLWPKPACVQDGAVYDFIIVGAGTAGCVVASNLAELKSVRILLIEAGGNPTFETKYPGYFPYMKHTDVDWNVASIPEKVMRYHKGGVADIGQGKMLGGSSSLSYMTYVRGNPIDYDNWAALTKDPSWAFKEVLPLFKKSENVIDKKILNSPLDIALHGTEGKLKLKKYYYNTTDAYFSAYEEIGIKHILDVNFRNLLGVTNALFTCSETERESTATSFLQPLKNNPYLDVLTNALVTKILFDDNKRAIGVEIRTKNDKTITVKAKKEVIISAGTIKGPQLLMLSGIGPRKHLLRKNIQVIADLPVGNNFQDHPICISAFKMGKRTPLTGPLDPHIIGFPVLDSYISLNKSNNYPDYEIFSIVIDAPEVFLLLCAVSFSFKNKICDTIIKELGDNQLYAAHNTLSYPKSRGRIRLNSTNIEDQPIVKLGYYLNEKDLENHAKAVINFHTILNSTFFKSVKAEIIDPQLKECKGLDKQSEEYWKCYCSGMVTTGHYYVGTCAMGKVVDSKLLVKGVKRLRIVDASIMPTIVASPTTAAVLMIAQKASRMIITKHSLT